MPQQLKKSITLTYLENATYDQIVARLERELELSCIGKFGELRIPTMTVTATRDNENKPEFSNTSSLCRRKMCHLKEKIVATETGKNKSESRTHPKSKQVHT